MGLFELAPGDVVFVPPTVSTRGTKRCNSCSRVFKTISGL